MSLRLVSRKRVVPLSLEQWPAARWSGRGQSRAVRRQLKNRQLLLAYARDGYNDQLGRPRVSLYSNTESRTDIKSWKKNLLPAGEYGKGGSVVVLTVKREKNTGASFYTAIALISSHLDSKSAPKRSQQIQDLETAANNAAGGQFDLGFFFGDLNYRLKVGGVVPANQVTPTEFATIIRERRQQLYLRDGLDIAMGAGTDFQGWTFPRPVSGNRDSNVLILPTYKREYKGNGGQRARAVAAQMARNPPPLTAIEKCYEFSVHKNPIIGWSRPFAGNVKECEAPRAGHYDIGWLDRIGYKVQAPTIHVTRFYSGALPDVVLSDHTCVYSVFDVQ